MALLSHFLERFSNLVLHGGLSNRKQDSADMAGTRRPRVSEDDIIEISSDDRSSIHSQHGGDSNQSLPRKRRCLKSPSLPSCPYYYDEKLDLKMYCGPGYEYFPIVFGTIKDHIVICDRWDKRSVPKDVRASDSHLASPALDLDGTVCSSLEDLGIDRIISVFPQIEHDFVRSSTHAW